MRFKTPAFAGLLLCLSLGVPLAGALAADPMVRFRGRIDSFDGTNLTLTARATGQHVIVAVPAAAGVVSATAAKLSDIQPGSFIGTAATTRPDGSQVALEVHVFAPEMRGAGEGRSAWDLGAGSTMTNGNVGSVTGTQGRTLVVQYQGGEQRIEVPPTAPVVATAKADRAIVKPGAEAVVSASRAADGALTARFLIVGVGGVTPPM